MRGSILMAISNKLGSMVLTTGNKSEMSVGYATLYGDMNGGFNPIKDVYKTEVYALARLRNQSPGRMSRAGAAGDPGADHHPCPDGRAAGRDQTDQDSLPPYDVLDDHSARASSSTIARLPSSSRARAFRGASAEDARTCVYNRRIQAAPGATRRQDNGAILAATAAIRSPTAFATCHDQRQQAVLADGALRAVTHRADPYRQCPHGGVQLAVRAQAWRPIRAALRRYRPRRARPSTSQRAIAADLAWLGIVPDLTVRQSERFDRYGAGRRAAQGDAAASIPATRPSRSSNCGASGSWRAARRRSMTARRLSSARADRQQLEAAGRRPHWRFLLEARKVAWNDLVRGDAGDRHRHPVRSGADPRRRQLSLHAAIGRRRHRSRHHPRHPRRGPCRQHRGADPDVRGARGQAAAIRPSQPAGRRPMARGCRSGSARCRSPACASRGSRRWRWRALRR